jgi:hypothetical protein
MVAGDLAGHGIRRWLQTVAPQQKENLIPFRGAQVLLRGAIVRQLLADLDLG